MATRNDFLSHNIAKSQLWLIFIRNLFISLLVTALFFLVIFSGTHYTKPVHGTSMQPTLNINGMDSQDIVFIDKNTTPKRGDIVVMDISYIPSQYTLIYDSNKSLLIKRVIATAGERIYMTYDNANNVTKIYVNGTELQENYIKSFCSKANYDNFVNQTHWYKHLNVESGEITIPDGMVFCMGDNRDNSKDCRFFGPVTTDSLLGVVDYVIYDGTLLNDILTWIYKFD